MKVNCGITSPLVTQLGFENLWQYLEGSRGLRSGSFKGIHKTDLRSGLQQAEIMAALIGW